jgi:mannose-6-phosphate isomerase
MKIIPKAWGYEIIVVNDDYCGKVLVLNPGYQCSVHRHPVKNETFYVIEGTADIELDDAHHYIPTSNSLTIPAGSWHRFRNMTEERIVMVEFSTRHSDDDVERKTASGPVEMFDPPGGVTGF